MGTTQAVIARLESGRTKPSTRTLERLAEATGMRLRISFEPSGAVPHRFTRSSKDAGGGVLNLDYGIRYGNTPRA